MANFFKGIITKPTATGGLAPCGKPIIELVTNSVDLPNAKTVVELGPGTGVFTEVILQKINPDALFFAIEINPDFVKATRERCPEAIVYQDSAENLDKYLDKHNVGKVDCIVSTLPWTLLGDDLREGILRKVKASLKPGGEFITVCYLHGKPLPGGRKFQKLLDQEFPNVNPTKPVWNRFLPMFAYKCSN